MMQKVPIHKLKEGMIIAQNVLTHGGQHILDSGKVLNKQSIMRLSFYNIKSVFVEDDGSLDPGDIMPEASPADTPPQISSPKVLAAQKFHTFQYDHTMVLTAVKTSFENYVNNNIPLDTYTLLQKIQGLFDSCKTSLELFDMLHNIYSTEDSIYAHCLNVGIICRQIGKWLKVDDKKLDLLTLSGLLMDIGKLRIPAEILNKPDKYTDEEFAIMKMHPRYSYELLAPLPLDPHIKKAALSHHERCDGSGYPMGLKQEEIDDYAMIAAIADVYDAMTAPRSYRAPLCAFQVIERFEQDGLQKYKPKYILTFLEYIAGTYQNHRVLLSNGKSATIVMINPTQPSRPIVKLDDGTCIDLSTQRDLFIQSVLSEH